MASSCLSPGSAAGGTHQLWRSHQNQPPGNGERHPEPTNVLRDCHWGWYRVRARKGQSQMVSTFTCTGTWASHCKLELDRGLGTPVQSIFWGFYLMLLSGPVFRFPGQAAGSEDLPIRHHSKALWDSSSFSVPTLIVPLPPRV